MDLQRMLRQARAGQWRLDEIAWDRPPRPMSREDEIAIVQYLTDMAGIERLAAALFEEQRRRADDPTLREIFDLFVQDELRHAEAALRLAAHYDVHGYRDYRENPHLTRFAPRFVDAIRYLSNEIANAYITSGELILDIALLRSLDDYVDDATLREVMARIDRDEARHIAVDFHMVEYYASDEYAALLEAAPRPLRERLRAIRALALMLWYVRPFFREVFFEPMERVDPSGRRMREVFKRLQLVSRRQRVQARPFVRFMTVVQDLYNDPRARRILGPALRRIIGVEPHLAEILFTEAELAAAEAMSLDEMAQEALAAKYAI